MQLSFPSITVSMLHIQNINMLNTVPLHQVCKYQLSSTRCSSWWNSSISASCHNTVLSAVLQLHMHLS